MKKPESHNLLEKLDRYVLGQLGGELSAEMNQSAFANQNICFGLLCMRLEVCLISLLVMPSFLPVKKFVGWRGWDRDDPKN